MLHEYVVVMKEAEVASSQVCLSVFLLFGLCFVTSVPTLPVMTVLLPSSVSLVVLLEISLLQKLVETLTVTQYSQREWLSAL